MDLGHSEDMLDALLPSILEGIFIPPKSSILLLFFGGRVRKRGRITPWLAMEMILSETAFISTCSVLDLGSLAFFLPPYNPKFLG